MGSVLSLLLIALFLIGIGEYVFIFFPELKNKHTHLAGTGLVFLGLCVISAVIYILSTSPVYTQMLQNNNPTMLPFVQDDGIYIKRAR